MAKQNSARLVKPAGQTIQRLRIEKGWDVGEMASRAGCTRKTVENVEASSPCYLFTLTGFSQAFGLSDNRPLLGDTAPPPIESSGGNRIQLKIRFRIPFTNFDFTNQLVSILDFIIKLIDPQGEVEVLGVAPGSVIVTIEIELNDAKMLISALGAGELEPIQASAIATDFGSGQVTEFLSPSMSLASAPETTAATKPEPPTPQTKPPSLLKRLSIWLFGTGGQSDPAPTYQDKPLSILERLRGGKPTSNH